MTTSLLRAEGLVKRYRLPHGWLCAPAPLRWAPSHEDAGTRS